MSGHSPNRKFVWILSAILVLFISGISTAGYYYFKQQEKNWTHKVHDELVAIADLKVGQIVSWYQERQADAEVLLDTRPLVAEARRVLTNPADGQARQNLFEWMEAVRNANDYAVVTLYDAQGAVRLSTEPDAERLDDHYAEYFQRALSIGTVVIADLYRSQPGRPIRLSILVPLRKKSDTGPPATGVILLQIDPDRFLYALVQRWPMPSRTAETLLVRREGNEVVYLNELRHRKNTALTFRLPIDPASRLPAAMAAQGREGVFEGEDYRGIPALAAVRRVGGTPWWLVAKVDREEVYAPLRVQARLIAMFAGALVLAATLGVGLVWYRRDSAFSRQELSLDRQRRVLAERIVYLTKHANDIILLYDRDFRILEANDRALEAYGYSLQELRQLTVRDLRAPQTRADFDRQVSAMKSAGAAIIETVHQRKDGTQFAVEISAHVAEIDGTTYGQGIIRDITERKRAEKSLRLSEQFAHATIDALAKHICVLDEKGTIIMVNKAWSHFAAANRLLGKNASEGVNYLEICDAAVGPDAEIAATFGAGIRAVMSGERDTFSMEYPCHSPNQQRWFLGRVTRFPVWTPARIVVAHEDITERMLARLALQEASQFNQQVIDNAQEGIVVYGRDLRYRVWNPFMERLSGVPAHDVLGRQPQEVFPFLREAGVIDTIETVLATERVISLDCPYTFSSSGRSGWVSGKSAPLRNSRGEVVGVISIVREITQARRAGNELRASKERLRRLAARLQAAREEESTRVAREIHDVLAQGLTRLKMDVAWLNRRLSKPIDQEIQGLCREKLAVMTSVADQAIQSVQKIATELRPAVLDSLGLAAAVEWQAKDFEANTGIHSEVSVPEQEILLSREQSTALFRVLQESLTNVYRHAGATKVEISLHTGETQLTLSVSDNGRGVEDSEIHSPRSLGLMGMGERALILNGHCEIMGRPGKGTTVELQIPLTSMSNPENEPC